MSELRDFFTANVGAAAALLGLLFVAVSVSTERVFGAAADPAKREGAERAFTALSNVFFVSLAVLMPRSAAQLVEIVAILAMVQAVVTSVALLRRYPELRTWRHLGILSLCIYALELAFAHRAATQSGPVDGLAYAIFGSYGYALGVAWQLLGGRSRSKA